MRLTNEELEDSQAYIWLAPKPSSKIRQVPIKKENTLF